MNANVLRKRNVHENRQSDHQVSKRFENKDNFFLVYSCLPTFFFALFLRYCCFFFQRKLLFLNYY